MLNSLIKTRIIFWSILGLVVLWLIWQGIVPGGVAVYEQNFEGDSYFIRRLTPDDRVADGEDAGAKYLIGDPVYFSLRTPRRFDQARLSVRYRNKSELPVVEAGVLVDRANWRYALMPLGNRTIDQLALVWSRIEEDGLLLLQREKRYGDIGAFLSQPPPVSEIAVYNYDPGLEYLLAGYEPATARQTVAYPLRGPFELFTYIKSETLDFSFEFYDLNQNKDADPIDINVYYQGELITSRHIDDDGIGTDSGEAGPVTAAKLELGGLPEGVYKIELRANSDIVAKAIGTAQAKLAFVGRLEFFNGNLENIELFTDSRQVQATTAYPDSTQAIEVGRGRIDLDKTYRQYETEVVRDSASSTVARLKLQKDGVTVSGDGVFAFSEGAFFDPRLRRLDRSLDIARDQINYVLAAYTAGEPSDGWQERSAALDLGQAYREKGAYSLIISIPGLRADDDIVDFVELDSIKIELRGKPLMQKIKELLN